MLDAHQLNVFLAAAKALNFTAAGRQLHMTQPSVSQHVQALEQHFEMPLFARTGRRLSLTDAGEALLPLAQKMVTMSQRIDETMESLKGEVYGHLLIGCSTTVGKYIIPLLLASFLRHYPKVQASCTVTSRHLALQMLSNGDVHLALGSAREFGHDVKFHNFMSDPIVLIAPLDHPWARRPWLEPAELIGADFIMREEGSGTLAVAAEGLAQLGLSTGQLHTVLTLGNPEAVALAVQEGIGVGFVSQMLVSRLVPDRVATINVRGLHLHQDIFIGCHTGQPETRAQAAFWDFVTDPHNPAVRRLNTAGAATDWPAFHPVPAYSQSF
jgi:DNA-binding transcriptional LysR family regulator